jgi:hypothetical protein
MLLRYVLKLDLLEMLSDELIKFLIPKIISEQTKRIKIFIKSEHVCTVK